MSLLYQDGTIQQGKVGGLDPSHSHTQTAETRRNSEQRSATFCTFKVSSYKLKLQKKLGHCGKYEEKQNTVICKSFSTYIYLNSAQRQEQDQEKNGKEVKRSKTAATFNSSVNKLVTGDDTRTGYKRRLLNIVHKQRGREHLHFVKDRWDGFF